MAQRVTVITPIMTEPGGRAWKLDARTLGANGGSAPVQHEPPPRSAQDRATAGVGSVQ
ncbi:hypothetical protein [Actinomadura luzonensis]|uniref:hypothetical protein n=1 Tax=Actinomadura luzonensis TaxID=2805427 RepID=UPI0038992E55